MSRPIRYQVLGSLRAGEGSRAQLGLAVHEDGRAEACVVVFVPDEAARDAALLARVKRETEHAAQLDHPNIVTVFGFAQLPEGPARVVEFADGESLRRVLSVTRALPPRLATRIIIDACTGVHYAHLAGNDDGSPLVHGDVRPETVLLSFSGVTKVTGYGALAFAPRPVDGQRVKGRQVHSSPEQIIGGRSAITIPSDVYLLGITFYELLTGVVPWADQGEAFDQAVLAYPLPPAPPGLIPEALWPILVTATQKKAAQRYPTPLAMREAIEAAAGGEIATVEELVTFLDGLFPGSGEVRAERKRTLDAGIADFARKQWALRDAQPAQAPAAPARDAVPTPAPPSRATTPGPQRAPAPPRVARPQAAEQPETPRPEGSSAPWVVLFLAVLIAAGAFVGWYHTSRSSALEPPTLTDDGLTSAVDAPASAPSPGAMAPASDADAGEASLGDGGLSEADAGPSSADAGTAPESVEDAGPPAPTELAVTIESRPILELSIDGTNVGKTPWTGQLPMGLRKLKLESKELLISASRTVTVAGDQPMTQRFAFEKGTVAVTAPAGAVIFVDGRKQGVAPLAAPLSIYEGFHRILVKVGQAQWTETFTLFEGQNVTFTVELE
ncbi:MAG: protein kinase [Myxococcaceae bacterium]|nr:protein kinase [Myxococcaceae bacterium]